MNIYSKKRSFISIIRIVVFGWLFIASIYSPAFGQTPIGDSDAERIAEARKLYTVMDLPALVDGLVEKAVSSGSGADKDSLRAFIQREIRWPYLEEMIVGALVKNFTASEIRALAEFQGNPAGKSSLKGYPAYLAEVGAPLQAEIQRVIAAGAFGRTRLRWESPGRELTADPGEDSVSTDYAFRNDGSRAVSLLAVTTSCGCTAAKPEKTIYQPGERGTLRAVFTVGSRTGLQEEKIYVTTDEPGKPKVTLQLKVKISEPLKITPRLLVWGIDEESAMKTVEIKVPAGQRMDVIGLDSVPDAFSAENSPDKDGLTFRVRVTPRPATGPMAGKFVVLADAGAGKVLRVPVFLRILPPKSPLKDDGGLSGDDVLWVDAQSAAEYGRSHIPGALPLTEEAWDTQFEALLARWTPGQRVVVDCPPPCQPGQVVRRLKAYGLENLHVIVSAN